MNETTMTVAGNLTGDPELRYTPGGSALCKFTVASTPRIFDLKSGGWKDGDVLFLQCTAWRDLAENIAESLKKGTRVVVTGKLRMSQWETTEGDKRLGYGLDVDDIGASMRFAQVAVKKLARTSAGPNPATQDPEPGF
jgi:single-strand DNA-binding protein